MGYHVMKGEKSTKRNKEGICLFFGNQVEKNKPRYYGPTGDGDFDQEDYDMWYDMYGHTRDWV